MIDSLPTFVQRWAGRVAFSILDQGAASIAHFVLNVLLVRWLPPSDYGVFAVTFSIYLFVSGIHSALILEPMITLAPARYAHRLAGYWSFLSRMHGGMSGALALLTVVAAGILRLGHGALRDTLMCMAAALPALLSLAVARQSCYVQMRSRLAAIGSLVYLVLLLSSVYVLRRMDLMSAPAAFLAMAGAAAIPALGVWTLGKPPAASVTATPETTRAMEVVSDHWAFGRWILVAGVAHNVATVIYVPLAGAVLGLAEAGALRALQLLIAPLQLVLNALHQVALPWISGRITERDQGYLKTFTPRLLGGYLVVAAAFVAPLLLAGPWILLQLYGPNQSIASSFAFPLLSVIALLGAFLAFFGLVVRVMQKPQGILWGKVTACAVTLAIAIPIVRAWGLLGALTGLLVCGLAELLVLVLFSVRTQQRT